MLKIRMAARSHIGLVRLSNEDNLYYNGTYRESQDLGQIYADEQEFEVGSALFAVCDGMGGEAYGEEAAHIAVSNMPKLEKDLSELGLVAWGPRMTEYLEDTNDKICKRIREHEGQRMGTTIVSLFLRAQKAQFSNLGDSRIYRFRDGELELLSTDHTQAQRLADLGIIEQSEVRKHPERHRLLQHLGIFPSEAELRPNISEPFDLLEGDLYLICSDGLNDNVGEEAIQEILETKDLDLKVVADELMAETLEQGAHDNMTFILIEVVELGNPSEFDAVPYEDVSDKSEERAFEGVAIELTSDEGHEELKDKHEDDITELTLSTVDSMFDDTLEMPVVHHPSEETSQTKRLTEEFIDHMRSAANDADLQLELGTLPQLHPVRVDGEDDSEERGRGTRDSYSPFEDTLTPPEPGTQGPSWTKGKVFSQPITTDDLDRFRKAREESLRRQQAYENSLGNDPEPMMNTINTNIELPRDQGSAIEASIKPARRSLRKTSRRYRKRTPYWRELIYLLASVLFGFFLAFLILNLASLF